jgi:hypothetical protein
VVAYCNYTIQVIGQLIKKNTRIRETGVIDISGCGKILPGVFSHESKRLMNTNPWSKTVLPVIYTTV